MLIIDSRSLNFIKSLNSSLNLSLTFISLGINLSVYKCFDRLDSLLSIKEFVFKNADTKPLAIVNVSKWLDLPFKKELVKMVECFINESSKVYAIASNEAADIEAHNDNILLEEFGLKNVATPIKVKSYKLTLKEVTKKK